jgi:GTP1/Obg family GTP-binding protein
MAQKYNNALKISVQKFDMFTKGDTMLNMQTFYESLVETSKNKDLYLNALVKITNASSVQMNALKSDRSWQDWGAQTVRPLEA